MKVKDYIIIALILVVLIQSYFNPKLSESRFNDTLDEMRVLILEQERRELQINLIQLQENEKDNYNYIDSVSADSIPIIFSTIIRQLKSRDSIKRVKTSTEGFE